jgi:hypothetical protein
MKVSVEKQCSSSNEPITNTTFSSMNSMYSWNFSTKIYDEKRVLHKFINGFISKCFCIANFELFFMVMTNKDLYKSKEVV